MYDFADQLGKRGAAGAMSRGGCSFGDSRLKLKLVLMNGAEVDDLYA